MSRTKKTMPAKGGKDSESPRQKNIFALRGTDEWKQWLDGFSARMGMPTTVLVEHALRELAKRNEYPTPPTRF